MNIFQTIQLLNQQTTINNNRWVIDFGDGLNKILRAAEHSPLKAVRDRYAICAKSLDNFQTDKGIVSKMDEALALSLVSCDLPEIDFEITTLKRFNDGVKQVTGFGEISEFTVSFYDYMTGSASAIMSLWHALVGDKTTGSLGFKKDYVLPEAYFYIYGPEAPGYDVEDWRDIPYLQKHKLVNLFPKKFPYGTWGDTAEVRKIDMSFVVDNVYPIEINSIDYRGDSNNIVHGVDYIDKNGNPVTVKQK